MINLARFKIGIITISLLAAALVWMPLADAGTGKSDLNKDRTVNYDDLVIFSSEYLEQNVEAVDWCAFWEASSLEDALYGRPPSFYIKHFSELLSFINNHFGCDLSDLNKDGAVNTDDLKIFSSHYLELNWETVDWCAFYTATAREERFEDKMTHYYQKRFRLLLGFIFDEFGCIRAPELMAVKNQPKSLTRVALNEDIFSDYYGYYYFSDARVGSVFIYDTNRYLFGELKNLDKPLGVAIDSQGYLLVGNNGRNNIEVYDPANGDLLAIFGEGLVKMPTAITIGSNGDIYVTDSKSHRVWVFESSYVHVRTIGVPGISDGQLKFPIDATIVTRDNDDIPVEEIFVADQGNKRIQVFDLQGNYLRQFGPPLVLSGWCLKYGFGCPNDAHGTFNRLQALGVDSQGRLHALDIFESGVTIIDPVSGAKLGSYGSWGGGTGQLRSPLDVLVTEWNEAIVTDNNSSVMEVFALP
jgi:DNA-binding beta-propeller fold protein YncE